MKTRSHILFLSLNTFSGEGGIPQVCKNLTYALSKICRDQQLKFCGLSLYDETADQKYINSGTFSGYRRQKMKFLLGVLSKQASAKTLILSHVNLLPIAYLIRKINSNIHIVLIAHGVEIWRDLSKWKQRFLKNEVQIWSVSIFTRNKIIDRHGLSSCNIQILNNCIDPFFKIPTDFSKPDYLLKRYGLSTQKVLLSITRMSCHDHQKGYDKVIKVMPYLLRFFPDLKYLLCGSQQLGEAIRLRQLVQTLGLTNHVILTGFIPGPELTDHYLIADLFVLPSKKEGFGIAFVESAACGCQTISGNADGSMEASAEGCSGLAIDPDDDIALQAAIIDGLSAGADIPAAVRQKACLSQFGHQHYENRIIELFGHKSFE